MRNRTQSRIGDLILCHIIQGTNDDDDGALLMLGGGGGGGCGFHDLKVATQYLVSQFLPQGAEIVF